MFFFRSIFDVSTAADNLRGEMLPGAVDQIEVLQETDDDKAPKIIQRQKSDPFMFYRVENNGNQDPEQDISRCFNVSDLLETAKTIMKINLVTISMLMTTLPHNVYVTIVYFGDFCPSQTISSVFGILQIPFVILLPIVIYKKLVKQI